MPITNSQVDTAIAAFVSAQPNWFTPITRVTDVESPALENNEDFAVTITGVAGGSVAASLTLLELQATTTAQKVFLHAAVTAALSTIVQNWFNPWTLQTAEADMPTNLDTAKMAFRVDEGTVDFSMTYNEFINPDYNKRFAIAAKVDELAAAVPAANYGPLTRLTPVTAMPSTTKDATRIEFTNKNGESVWLRYSELATAAIRNSELLEQAGIDGKVQSLISKISTINTAAQAMSQPHDEDDYNDLIGMLKDISEIKGSI